MSRIADMVTAWSALRGMTVFMSMKVASNGRASRMEPNPDNPCVKPARKVIKLRRMYVLDNDASEKHALHYDDLSPESQREKRLEVILRNELTYAVF